MKKTTIAAASALLCLIPLTSFASPQSSSSADDKISSLESKNKELIKRIDALEKLVKAPADNVAQATAKTIDASSNVIRSNHEFAYSMLDPNTHIDRKELLILNSKSNGQLQPESVYLSGAITAIMDVQKSNTESKFGYLMRHPTASNQRTKNVSEALIHSAQVGLTANLNNWITGYIEMLYSPEMSFGAGTITDLGRNQVQVRQSYVLLGDLSKSPLYGSIGKMAVPFGMTDTVSPFTQSTVYHAFGGLAYGVKAGYSADNFNVTLMGVQGGAEFRSANVPVDKTNIPSKLNNFAADVHYQFNVSSEANILLGASFIKGSAYCASFPVTHFSSCKKENGATAAYATMQMGKTFLKAEYANTSDVWPGSFNPTIPAFKASKVNSFDLGGRYESDLAGKRLDYSVEFSQFGAGPKGAPWEKQSQTVFGLAYFPIKNAKLFAEYIRTKGYAPLNFVSGGNLGDGVSWSNRNASSNIFMVGTNVAF